MFLPCYCSFVHYPLDNTNETLLHYLTKGTTIDNFTFGYGTIKSFSSWNVKKWSSDGINFRRTIFINQHFEKTKHWTKSTQKLPLGCSNICHFSKIIFSVIIFKKKCHKKHIKTCKKSFAETKGLWAFCVCMIHIISQLNLSEIQANKIITHHLTSLKCLELFWQQIIGNIVKHTQMKLLRKINPQKKVNPHNYSTS